ncbi:hypothetical protein ACFZDK_55710, partial [Streptomyces sp. NPDC007901]|uniref:hypothetical protein n=1 Tax=Streptomyces sp. NPDC007901 TaxID=3364785 RepID=UPI0036E902CE
RERNSPVEVRPGQTPAHSQPLIPYTTTRDAIAQPGLQARKATNEQLLLLAGTEKFVRDTSAGDFTVYCSR